jgi:hypothetical protein
MPKIGLKQVGYKAPKIWNKKSPNFGIPKKKCHPKQPHEEAHNIV